MKEYRLTEAEQKLAEIIWANEPIASPDLVKLCEVVLNWKKSTTYTMLKKLEIKEIFINNKGTVESLLTKEEFYTEQSKQIVDEGFDGSFPRFLAAFSRQKKLSNQEICELQELINEYYYKKPALWVLLVAAIAILTVIIGLITNPKPNEDTWDLRPMIMVNGELYLDTREKIPVEIDESAIVGEINSSVDSSKKPTEEGQTNFGFEGAEYAYFEDNIAVLSGNNEWILFEKEMKSDEVSIYLNKMNNDGGMYDEIIVETRDNKKTFSWKNVANPTYVPIKYIADVDNDNKDEIIILLTTGYGTGIYVQDLHILNLEDLTEIDFEDPIEAINNSVYSSITINEDKVNVTVKWDEKILEKSYSKWIITSEIHGLKI